MTAVTTLALRDEQTTSKAASAHLRRRESVLFGPRVYDYQIDVLETGPAKDRVIGRVRAQIQDLRIGYRITVTGFGPGAFKPGKIRDASASREFFDNHGEPAPTREAAGQLYQSVMQDALTWLREQTGVADLDALPGASLSTPVPGTELAS